MSSYQWNIADDWTGCSCAALRVLSTEIGWLRQAPLRANARAMNEHIDRLTTWRALDLPWAASRLVHRNRLLKLAREGSSMTASDLSKFEPSRRYATLFAMATESMATVADEIIELHDRIIGRLIRTAQNKQNQATLASRSTVAAMMRVHSRLGDALFAAKENGEDPFAAIETAIGWESLATSIAQAKEMTRPGLEDHLALVSSHFTTLRRYTPAFLAVLDLHAARIHRPSLRTHELVRLQVRTTDPQHWKNPALHTRQRSRTPGPGAADRRNDQHENNRPALGRDPQARRVHQNRHRDRVPDDAANSAPTRAKTGSPSHCGNWG